jgi:hypothetical protein
VPTQIDFRGVMLFEYSKTTQRLNRILLPDGDEGGKQKKWGNDKKHPDGATARVHYAGLVFQEDRALHVVHVPLKGVEVRIHEVHSEDAPTVDLGGLPKLHAVATGKKVQPGYGAITVYLKGGEVIQEPPLPKGFVADEFGGSEITHHGARLTCNHAIEVGVFLNEQRLWYCNVGEHDQLAIYNYETRYPSIYDLNDVGACDEELVEDIDFKWLYSLLDDHGQDLPAPKVKCDTKTVTVFTCFPAVWEADDSE